MEYSKSALRCLPFGVPIGVTGLLVATVACVGQSECDSLNESPPLSSAITVLGENGRYEFGLRIPSAWYVQIVDDAVEVPPSLSMSEWPDEWSGLIALLLDQMDLGLPVRMRVGGNDSRIPSSPRGDTVPLRRAHIYWQLGTGSVSAHTQARLIDAFNRDVVAGIIESHGGMGPVSVSSGVEVLGEREWSVMDMSFQRAVHDYVAYVSLRIYSSSIDTTGVVIAFIGWNAEVIEISRHLVASFGVMNQ